MRFIKVELSVAILKNSKRIIIHDFPNQQHVLPIKLNFHDPEVTISMTRGKKSKHQSLFPY
jgi:hypothetical protein